MLKKRLIFTLLMDENYFVITRNFSLQRFGDKEWLVNQYDFDKITLNIDEIILLNITRENYNFENFLDHIKFINKKCFIPISVGGGINTMYKAERIFSSGADKIVLNSSLYEKPELAIKISRTYGSQSIIASIDVKKNNNNYEVYINNGNKNINKKLDLYLKDIINLPIGEIYINSIDRDGTGIGYDLDVLKFISNNIKIPIIISGGAGNYKHFLEGLKNLKVDAVSTSHLFNFIGDGLINARKSLLNNGIKLAIR